MDEKIRLVLILTLADAKALLDEAWRAPNPYFTEEWAAYKGVVELMVELFRDGLLPLTMDRLRIIHLGSFYKAGKR
jgi:hypothetical protein